MLSYDAENHLTGVSRRSNLSASSGRSGSAVTLSWAAASGATACEVWRGTTPYFTPGASGSVKATTTTATSYSDPGRSGDPNTNYYYLIVATAGGCPLGVSQRIGEFDFALVPGTLLSVAAVRTAEAAGPARGRDPSDLPTRSHRRSFAIPNWPQNTSLLPSKRIPPSCS